MNRLTNKYALIKEAASRFKAVREDYQVWLDYQHTRGIVLVRPDYVSIKKTNTVYCILTREMNVWQWCKIANGLKTEGYSPILLNPNGLK